MYRPLADRIRPDNLDDVFGQKHILGEGGLLGLPLSPNVVPGKSNYLGFTFLPRKGESLELKKTYFLK